jgi:hypothetical protein
MLLKAVGQSVSTAKRVKKNPLEMPKYLLLANRRGGRIAQQLLGKTGQFPFISFERLLFCSHLLQVEEAAKKFLKRSTVLLLFLLFPTISLVARLKLARHSP